MLQMVEFRVYGFGSGPSSSMTLTSGRLIVLSHHNFPHFKVVQDAQYPQDVLGGSRGLAAGFQTGISGAMVWLRGVTMEIEFRYRVYRLLYGLQVYTLQNRWFAAPLGKDLGGI